MYIRPIYKSFYVITFAVINVNCYIFCALVLFLCRIIFHILSKVSRNIYHKLELNPIVLNFLHVFNALMPLIGITQVSIYRIDPHGWSRPTITLTSHCF